MMYADKFGQNWTELEVAAMNTNERKTREVQIVANSEWGW